jgi:uncharacterized protein (TIRG00374 family)
MDRKKIYQAVIFLIIGIGLFLLVFKDTDVKQLKAEIAQFSLFWIGISIVLNLISQGVRAVRWKQLFTPLPYNPKGYNLFFAVLILGFTNQIIPRGGEFAKLSIINQTDKIPFSKLLGIALAERLTDLVILLAIFIFLVVWQLSLIKQLLEVPEISFTLPNLGQIFLIMAIAIAVIALLFLTIKRFNWFKKIRNKLISFKNNIVEGFSTIKRIKQKTKYILMSIAIYAIWLLMLYVLFFAYPATQALPFKVAAFTFGLATMAFLLPIQSGMGAWHFVVIQCLLLFGVDVESGEAFSLVAHAATNLIYIPMGLIAFALLPLVNTKNKKYAK